MHNYAKGFVMEINMAICYDFDKTLSISNMQEFGLIQHFGLEPEEFWEKCSEFTKNHQTEPVLCYMKLVADYIKQSNVENHKEFLASFAKNVIYYDGVLTWFDRINKYAKSKGINLKHYIISSGFKEIIDATSISKYFDKVYASFFTYDEDNKISWPSQALDFTNKTQYLYRINKGTLDINDSTINSFMDQESRPVPLSNIIYIGDSETDIPSMRMIKKNGGITICVYNKEKPIKQNIKDLLTKDKVNYLVEADYSENSVLEKIVKEGIKRVKSQQGLKNLTKYQKTKIDKK